MRSSYVDVPFAAPTLCAVRLSTGIQLFGKAERISASVSFSAPAGSSARSDHAEGAPPNPVARVRLYESIATATGSATMSDAMAPSGG